MSSDELMRFLIQILTDRGQCWWVKIARHDFEFGRHVFVGEETVCHGRFVRARLFDHLGRQVIDDVIPTVFSEYPISMTPEVVCDTDLE